MPYAPGGATGTKKTKKILGLNIFEGGTYRRIVLWSTRSPVY
jgi:hypothetical protein